MLRKRQEELALKKMSNTDTPLGTLEKLREKQQATGSAYVVLSNKSSAAEQKYVVAPLLYAVWRSACTLSSFVRLSALSPARIFVASLETPSPAFRSQRPHLNP